MKKTTNSSAPSRPGSIEASFRKSMGFTKVTSYSGKPLSPADIDVSLRRLHYKKLLVLLSESGRQELPRVIRLDNGREFTWRAAS